MVDWETPVAEEQGNDDNPWDIPITTSTTMTISIFIVIIIIIIATKVAVLLEVVKSLTGIILDEPLWITRLLIITITTIISMTMKTAA